jgi:divalent metal cation (Fe/Co/Zn/Cd) transporter
MTQVISTSVLTCPQCQHSQAAPMPEDSCLYFYECENCGEVIKPKEGDCCVHCSYGTEACPPVKAQKNKSYQKHLQVALILSLITIGYNSLEGLVSTFFGASDETLALFGFGVDSFVEVLSGLGIAHMVMRMKKNPVGERDRFEKTALQITGSAFYVLTAGLVIGAGLAIFSGAAPETTRAGIIISVISIATMYFLYKAKLKVGKVLDSAPIISDANCTKTCFYLSFILLGSSVLYEAFSIPYVDALGSLGIAWYAFKEGKEAFEKANSGNLGCSDDCC